MSETTTKATAGWRWCPVRRLHLRPETDQETGEERWLARVADGRNGEERRLARVADGQTDLTTPDRPANVPAAAAWDDRAKLWSVTAWPQPESPRRWWTWDGTALDRTQVQALAPRPQGPWELSTAEARRVQAARPAASPALVTQARIEVARVRGLHEVQAAELRALEAQLDQLPDSVLSGLLPLLRAGSLATEAAIRRPADLPRDGS